MIHEAVRARVADACRHLSRNGLVVGTAGNVSVRVGDQVVISPSGGKVVAAGRFTTLSGTPAYATTPSSSIAGFPATSGCVRASSTTNAQTSCCSGVSRNIVPRSLRVTHAVLLPLRWS